MHRKKKRTFARIVLLISLQLLIAESITETYLATQNTLQNNGHWTVSKEALKLKPPGWNEISVTTQALARNRLNLGVWHGFQEIIHYKKVSVGEVSFDFFLDKGAYMAFLFNKDTSGFYGIRISNHPAFRHIYFVASDAGQFLDKSAFAISNLKNRGWNHARVVFKNNECALFINRRFVKNFVCSVFPEAYIGFRGSLHPAYIDNVLVRDAEGRVILDEDFCNRRQHLCVFFCVFLILTVAFLPFALSSTAIIIGIIVLLLSVFFNQITMSYLTLYPQKGLKTVEQGMDYSYAQAKSIYTRIMDKYNNASPGTLRILFVGTSQTFGTGASSEDDTMVRVAEKELTRFIKGRIRLECVNGGAEGMICEGLWDIYAKKMIPGIFSIVAINLGSNDTFTPPLSYLNCIQRFAAINVDRKVKTVFIQEANTLELGLAALPLDGAMEATGKTLGIPVIKLHKYLFNNYDQGFLWWDFVHLTSFGYSLAGSYLGDELLKIIAQEMLRLKQ